MRKYDKALFILIFVTMWLALNGVVAIISLRWITPTAIILFLLIEFLNIGLAYGMTQSILSWFTFPKWPPKLAHLDSYPSVAVLYTTCDDLIPHCLESLSDQTYPNCDVFVLDDSTDERWHQEIDSIAERHGFHIVRRKGRKGFKAGSLNNWLSEFGEWYEYFVVTDADSLLPRNFLTEMMLYAEHPLNSTTALFQSKLVPWNQEDILARSSAQLFPVTIHKMDRLLNRYGFLPSWGHNILYRTAAILKLGGFDERFSWVSVPTRRCSII